MRDLLTALALMLLVALTGAAIAPHVLDWEARRAGLDARLSAALGLPARSEGPIGLRILPSPRLTLSTLFVGGEEPDAPTARLDAVTLELAPLPLLRREARVVEARAARADLTLVVGASGRIAGPAPRLPARLAADWRVVIERLSLADGALRLRRAQSAGVASFAPLSLAASASSLEGPWRLDGHVAGFAFHIATGERDAEGRLRVKAALGGGAFPRLDLDGAVGDTVAGQARLVAGPPGQDAALSPPVPMMLAARVTGDWAGLDLGEVTLDAGEGAGALRLAGSGRLSLLPQPGLALALQAAQADLETLLPPVIAVFRSPGGFGPPPVWARSSLPVSLALAIERANLLDEDVRDARLDLSLGPQGMTLTRLEAGLPGDARVAFHGQGLWQDDSRLDGRLVLEAAAPARFLLWARRLGLPALDPPATGSIALAADLVASPFLAAARNLDLAWGAGRITGAARYNPPETPEGRARLEAQLAANGLDLETLPVISRNGNWAERLDLDLALDAKGLSLGAAGRAARASAGRVRARLQADAQGLTVETLDIADLAGIDARMSGRLALAGGGEATGRVEARRLAPVATLISRLGGLESLPAFLPPGLAEAPFDGTLRLASTPGGTPGLDLVGQSGSARVTLRADFPAGGTTLLPDEARLTLQGDNATRVDLAVSRGPDGARAVTASAQAEGVTIETLRPLTFHAGEAVPGAGQVRLRARDLGPLAGFLGVPLTPEAASAGADLALGINMAGETIAFRPQGRIAGVRIDGAVDLDPGSRGLSGQIALERARLPGLLFPWLGAPDPADASRLWPAARFPAAIALPVTGDVQIGIGTLALGGGLEARAVSGRLSWTTRGLTLRDFTLTLGGPSPRETALHGTAALSRDGGRAALTLDLDVADAVALLPEATGRLVGGQLPLGLKLGAAGESVAALAANLNGAGQGRWEAPALPGMPADAPARAAVPLLGQDALPGLPQVEARLAETLDEAAAEPSPATGGEAVTLPVTASGGTLRIGPALLTDGAGTTSLQAEIDLKTLRLMARTHLRAAASPTGWAGAPPQAAVLWEGPLGAPQRRLDATALLNGIAAIRLQRELERIEAFEQDARERAFFQRRLRSERFRPVIPTP